MDPEPRVGGGGGGPAEGQKKKVTTINLMAEVVSDPPVVTLEGSSRVQDASQSL